MFSHATLVMALIMTSTVSWNTRVNAAPITFNTALPVAEGEFVARAQLIVIQSGDDPSGADRDRTAKAAVSVLGYGVNSKLAVFSPRAPYRRDPLVNRQSFTASNSCR